MDQVVGLLGLPTPEFIKMDVDGIEHLILAAGTEVLRKVQGVLVEVNDDFAEQARLCRDNLEEAGLTLQDKRHAEMFDAPSSAYRGTFNQIWRRV